MKLISIILENSQAPEAKLYGPAQKASQVPETGITIINKSAYNVIKDCATFTVKYLPHYIFGLYANPISSLKGKLERADIQEFIDAANQDIILHQLLILIKSKLPDFYNHSIPAADKDPYGEYEGFSVKAELNDVDLFCAAFCN